MDSLPLRDLLETTKDGDWGKGEPSKGFVPYRVIRGADFPHVRSGNVMTTPLRYLKVGTVDRRTLQPKDIIIETAGGNRDRPTGRTVYVTEKLLSSYDFPVTCASFSRFLRVDRSKAEPDYIYWYLQHLYKRGEMWEHQVQHTGVARFQYTRFAESVRIPLPSRDLQRSIAEVLNTLDAKIELIYHNNKTLEALARAIFKSWFVDFDPVRAKMDSHVPIGMDTETAALFPDGFEKSVAGEIPWGWKMSKVGNVLTAVGGGTPSTKEPLYWKNGVHFFATPKDLSNLSASILLETARKVTDAGLSKISSGLLPTGVVLLSSRAPVGYLAITKVPVCINQGFIAMICDGPVSNFYMFLWAHANMDQIKGRASGTTFAEISKTNFRPIKIVIPLPEIMEAFNKIVEPIFEKIAANLEESRTLADLRDALLPRLISGEFRVNDVS